MAKIIGGIGASHTPTIAFAKDAKKDNDPAWKPIFDDFAVVRDWVKAHNIDVMFFIFNDHVTSFFFDHYSPFALGIDSRYEVADEGGGPRKFPAANGHLGMSRHIAHYMMEHQFDISAFQNKPLDHGFFSPYSMIVPSETGEWSGTVVPLQMGVLQFPVPTAKRCYDFGKTLRQAIESYPEDLNVAIVATGGLSHQVHGERCGFNNEDWDNEFLDLLEKSPEQLTHVTHAEYAERGGMEGAEVIMWLVMRGALSEQVNVVHRSTYLPSMTNIATIIYEDQGSHTKTADASVPQQLVGAEKLTGTYPFTVETSQRAYRLNDFLHRLIEPEHRHRFVNDQEALMTEYRLTDEEKDMVRNQRWIEMIRYGAIFFVLEKTAAVLGKSNPELYASMRGETMEEFQATRRQAITYSVSGQ